MVLCHREHLHQVDLFAPAEKKITDREYQARRRGQKKMDERNRKMASEDITPRKTTFETQKDYLRSHEKELKTVRANVAAILGKDLSCVSKGGTAAPFFRSIQPEIHNVPVIKRNQSKRILLPEIIHQAVLTAPAEVTCTRVLQPGLHFFYNPWKAEKPCRIALSSKWTCSSPILSSQMDKIKKNRTYFSPHKGLLFYGTENQTDRH